MTATTVEDLMRLQTMHLRHTHAPRRHNQEGTGPLPRPEATRHVGSRASMSGAALHELH